MKNKTRETITRITVDLDTRNISDLIRCLKTLKKYHFNKELEVKTSPTGKGFHCIAWSDKGVTFRKLLRIRLKAGDDRIRCALDNMGKRQIQVLFTSKEKQKTNIQINNTKMEHEVKGSEKNTKISYGETHGRA